jgi:hypothetical protein
MDCNTSAFSRSFLDIERFTPWKRLTRKLQTVCSIAPSMFCVVRVYMPWCRESVDLILHCAVSYLRWIVTSISGDYSDQYPEFSLINQSLNKHLMLLNALSDCTLHSHSWVEVHGVSAFCVRSTHPGRMFGRTLWSLFWWRNADIKLILPAAAARKSRIKFNVPPKWTQFTGVRSIFRGPSRVYWFDCKHDGDPNA